MNNVLQKINIKQNILTKPPPKQKKFNNVKRHVTMIKSFNYEADLLYMPRTKHGYKYILAVVDLADDSFDIQPLRNKKSSEIVEAFKEIVKRKYIKIPEVSIRTDQGTEFKHEFDKYLKQHKIYHRLSLPYRHKQMANVECLNKQLYYIFSAYMNMKEEETDNPYNEWMDIIDDVRKYLNEERKLDILPPNEWLKSLNYTLKDVEPKYKIGDFVFFKLDHPKSALNENQPTANFRVGDYYYDPTPRKINRIIYMLDYPYIRYTLNGVKHVSYCEEELIHSNEKFEKYMIKKIIDMKTEKKQKFIKVWWKGFLKSDSTWEKQTDILTDIGKTNLDRLLKDYEDSLK